MRALSDRDLERSAAAMGNGLSKKGGLEPLEPVHPRLGKDCSADPGELDSGYEQDAPAAIRLREFPVVQVSRPWIGGRQDGFAEPSELESPRH